ncbi:sensor histidine kinase [Frankia sp. R82]|uniref:sensor histidine kinase n=1 Tax=Frankia sp. R82 TaxID=2950553 RepID=UPI0020434EE4|nr:histidine kinase [Frankia sp. R82]MCM3886668.1 histidine kinase [Frankia sp. R82]
MPVLVSGLFRAAVYTRWLHMATGGVFAGICVMVVPGFSESLPRTLLACFLSPLPVLALAALVPATRRAEGVQARWLLRPPDSAEIGLAPSRTLADRWRTALWLLCRTWFGVAVLTLTVNIAALAGRLGSAPFRPGPLRFAGTRLLAGDRLLLGPVLVAPLVLVLLWAMLGAGALQLRVAQALLGPSPTERLAQAEQRAEQLLERNRLAAELHDSLGHALTVTVLQAAAARQVATTDPAFVHRALTAIEEVGRRAMDDLERTLAILRDAPEPRARPTLGELDALLDVARIAGTPIVADVAVRVAGISAVVSREAYRILQEAVTNALRHAPGCPMTIDVAVEGPLLRLRAVNPLPTGSVRPARHDGKGLRGAKERAVLLGGEFEVTSQESHWIVEARLPLGVRFGVPSARPAAVRFGGDVHTGRDTAMPRQ